MLTDLDFGILFRNFKQQKILIIGDVMIDAYLWGTAKRISPEAPVPVVSNIMVDKRLGGAANVALNIKAMGAVPILCAVIGEDEPGRQFLELLAEENLTDIGIIVDEERMTTQKTRIISGTQHLLRVDEEEDTLISENTEKKLIEFVSTLLKEKKMNALVFQDYDKGVISPRLIDQIIPLAKKMKIPVLVDPKKRNFMQYEGVSLFKPNFHELLEGLKADIAKSDLEGIAGMLSGFRELKKHDIILLTLSELGVLINQGKEVHHIAAEIRNIADVSGAGDTVISVATLCLAAKLNPVDIAFLSNLAGGLVCEKPGVVSIDPIQLIEEALMIQDEERFSDR